MLTRLTSRSVARPSARRQLATYHQHLPRHNLFLRSKWRTFHGTSRTSGILDLGGNRAGPAVADPISPRTLVTATDMMPQVTTDVHVSELDSDAPIRRRSLSRSMSRLPIIDPSHPFVLHDITPLTRHDRFHRNIFSSGYDAHDLLQNLSACLRVGRFDRAQALVRRMIEKHPDCRPQLYDSRKQFLVALVNQAITEGSEITFKHAQRWFEVEVTADPAYLEPGVFAIMIKGALQLLDGSKRDRTIRRYLHSADQVGDYARHETMASEEFTDEELEVLVRLQPDKYQDYLSEVDRPVQSEDSDKLLEAADQQPDPISFRPVNQKGLGLKTLLQTLVPLRDIRPNDVDLTRFQEALEENAVETAVERWRTEHEAMIKMGINTSLSSKAMSALMWEWHTGMVPTITKELAEVREALSLEQTRDRKRKDDRLEWGPYVEAIPVERLCGASILTLLNMFSQQSNQGYGTHEIGLRFLVRRLGEQVEELAMPFDRYRKKASKGANSKSRLKILNKLRKSQSPSQGAPDQDVALVQAARQQIHRKWPSHIKVKIGAFLVSKLISAARVAVTTTRAKSGEPASFKVPAFTHSHRLIDGKRQGLVLVHPKILKLLTREPVRGSVGARLPMVMEPQPWTGFQEGAYLKFPVPVVRAAHADETQAVYLAAAAEKGDMDQVFHGLDVLGRTPWRVNDRILQVLSEVWNSGEAVADIPPENPALPYPEEPDKSEGKKAYATFKRKVLEIDNEKSGYHSNRCYLNFQLEVANSFRGRDIYFPHNMDFRGRAYPIPPILNHIGADHARGLLQFGHGKELGEVGLHWLKIHLSNLFGFDKASLQERADFTTSHLKDIFDSATNPLGGDRWWLKAEDPWQCLAVCFDLKDAYDLPDPTKHISRIPVHQDGSCNGLQHYAALGGDQAGASQVNLEPSDRPQDIYTGVADLVRSMIRQDASLEADCPDKSMAIKLQDKITRKVVKQTVMTNVYGVTFIGARDQVKRQLKEIWDHSLGDVYPASNYVAKKIFRALSSMFTGAVKIQQWFGVCSNRIATSVSPEQISQLSEMMGESTSGKDHKRKNSSDIEASAKDLMQFRSPLIWTTPLKMPVVQPYRNHRTRDVTTEMQMFTTKIPTRGEPVDRRRQVQGFAPNFVHSLDATHMQLSAAESHEQGLSFAAVHDSFWTHPADIPNINRVLRDAFIRMHKEDVIGRLRAEFQARYKGHFYSGAVDQSSEAGRLIRQWRKDRTKKVSNSASYEELIMEQQRQRLLTSEDAGDRQKGMQMVTPASIAEACDATQQSVDDALVFKLGDMTSQAEDEAQAKPADDLDEDGEVKDADSNDHATSADADSMDSKDTTHSRIEDPHKPDIEAQQETKARAPSKKVKLWLPLTFPEAPPRGDFDVTRLRNSTYFFS